MEENGDAWLEKIIMNISDILFKWASGGEVNCLPVNICSKQNCRPDIKRTRICIVGYGYLNNKMKPKGTATLDYTIKGVYFLIVDV